MTKKRFAPEQIIMKLRQAEMLLSQDQTIKQVCRSIEISEQTYYRSAFNVRCSDKDMDNSSFSYDSS